MNWITNIASSTALPKINNIEEEAGKLAVVRILLGFFMMYRVYQLVDVSQIYFDTPDAYNLGLVFLGLSFLFMIGFLTPLVTAIILIYWHRLDTSMSTFTLGSSILMLLISVYLVSNISGIRYSIDAYFLKKRGVFSSFLKKLYGVFGAPGKLKLQTIYFLAFFTYMLISLGAIMWHFQDPSWMAGTTIIELMTNSFLSKYYEFFRMIHIGFPELFLYFSIFSVIGQSVFQVMAIPVMFNRYGLMFVKMWGIGFFMASLFIIQLSYLPHIELLLWFVVFYKRGEDSHVKIIYDDYCNLCKRAVKFFKWVNWNKAYEFVPLSTNMNLLEEKGLTREELQSEMHGFIGNKLFVGYDLYVKLSFENPLLLIVWPFMIIGKYTKIGSFIYGYIAKNRRKFFGTCEIAFNVNKEVSKPFMPKEQDKFIFNGIGLFTVGILIVYVLFQYPFVQNNTVRYYQSKNKMETFSNMITWLNRTPFVMPKVFNKTDLMMGNRWAVIYRLKNGQKELVPITNVDGSRANYAGFDWFYYSNHNSDILYFGNTLKYRRAFIGQDPKVYNQQGNYGFAMLSNRIKYDYRNTPRSRIWKERCGPEGEEAPEKEAEALPD